MKRRSQQVFHYTTSPKRRTIFGLLALTRIFLASERKTRVNRFCDVLVAANIKEGIFKGCMQLTQTHAFTHVQYRVQCGPFNNHGTQASPEFDSDLNFPYHSKHAACLLQIQDCNLLKIKRKS